MYSGADTIKSAMRNIFHALGHFFSRPRAIVVLFLKAVHSLILWAFVFLGLILGDLLIPLIQMFVRDKKQVAFLWSKYGSKIILLLSGIRVRVDGLKNFPRERPMIIMPNHQGHFDYPILFSFIPFRFSYIAKKELFSVPIFGRYSRIAGFYLLDRQAAMSAYNTLEEVGGAIRAGDSILIFPEGTRSLDGNIGEFKGGGLKLAHKMGVPVLPIAISGSLGIMKRGTWLVNPRKVKVKIGKPVNFAKNEDVDPETYKNSIKQLRDVVVELYTELEKE